MEGGRRSCGASWQRKYCLMCQPGVIVALVSCWCRQGVWPVVLISLRSPPPLTFLLFFWGEVSPHCGSQAGASETTSCLCHQLSPALSILPYWLNRWRTFEWQAPLRPPSRPPPTFPPHPAYRGIIDIHPLARSRPPSLCFESFICKLRDKTYGANLQQINSDPSWLSARDIQRELLDVQHLSVFEALLYSLAKCAGKECQQRHSGPVMCILLTRWHNDVNYQRKLVLCKSARLS